MKKAAVTIDLDLVDHLNGGDVDEMEQAFPFFQQFCMENPWLKTTWFIRIDDQMQQRFGNPDYIFTAHADKLKWLTNNGHELGWHFHSYRNTEGKWKQNTDEIEVAQELVNHYPAAQKYGLRLLRMGWTYHTNMTMKTINKFDLDADCSAMPRPGYAWEISLRNWENTPVAPYFPSISDYRKPGNPCYGIPEFPLTVMPIEAPYDTEPGVLRYLNPCYHSNIFEKALNAFSGDQLNLICHPYEFLPASKPHDMLSFNASVFAGNLKYLKQCGYTSCVLGEMVAGFLNAQYEKHD